VNALLCEEAFDAVDEQERAELSKGSTTETHEQTKKTSEHTKETNQHTQETYEYTKETYERTKETYELRTFPKVARYYIYKP